MRQFTLVVVAIASLAAFVAWMDVPADLATDVDTGCDGALAGCSPPGCPDIACPGISCQGFACP